MFLKNLIIVIAMHASTRTLKKKQLMLYEHMEKQRDAVQLANIFSYYKNEANVLAAVKQGIVKLD
jgi:hypothetical protein